MHSYSITQLVKLTGLSRATIYREIKDKKLEITKIRTRTVVTEAQLSTWLHQKPQRTS